MASGGAEIGYGNWLPYLDALARGNDFVLLAGTFPVSPLGILSLPAKPILKAADIVGKKILVQGPNERTAIDATLALNNLPKQWVPVPAGFSPEPSQSDRSDLMERTSFCSSAFTGWAFTWGSATSTPCWMSGAVDRSRCAYEPSDLSVLRAA